MAVIRATGRASPPPAEDSAQVHDVPGADQFQAGPGLHRQPAGGVHVPAVPVSNPPPGSSTRTGWPTVAHQSRYSARSQAASGSAVHAR